MDDAPIFSGDPASLSSLPTQRSQGGTRRPGEPPPSMAFAEDSMPTAVSGRGTAGVLGR